MITRRTLSLGLMMTTLLAVMIAGNVQALAQGKGKGGGKKEPDPPPPQGFRYTMTLLGTRLGTLDGRSSSAEAMNELGDIIGDVGDASHNSHPYVYYADAEIMIPFHDLLDEADLPQWGRWWWLYGINMSGQICGEAARYIDGEFDGFHAVRFTPAHTDEHGENWPARVETVAPAEAVLNEHIYSTAYGINEHGDVTGYYFNETPDGIRRRAFVFTDDGGAKDIGDLGGDSASAQAINNHGQVTGTSRLADGRNRAFLYTPGFGMENLGVILASKDSDFSSGRDLNDHGHVIGRSSARQYRGWPTWRAFRDVGNGPEDLGTFGGANSLVFSVNNCGEIVGWANDKDGRMVFFLFTPDAGLLELETLIDNLPEGTTRIRAAQINDAGEICGWITVDGVSQAFLLKRN